MNCCDFLQSWFLCGATIVITHTGHQTASLFHSLHRVAQGQFYLLGKRNLNVRFYETSLSSAGLFFTRLIKMGSKYVFMSTVVAMPKCMSVLWMKEYSSWCAFYYREQSRLMSVCLFPLYLGEHCTCAKGISDVWIKSLTSDCKE